MFEFLSAHPCLTGKKVLLYKQVIWFLQNEFCLPLNTDSVNGRHENPYFRPFFRRFYAYSYCSSLGLLFKLTLPSLKNGYPVTDSSKDVVSTFQGYHVPTVLQFVLLV